MERPDVLLLDEPFNALDAKSIENTKRILREEQAAGATILFTSHSDRDVRELADHTYRIVDHKIVTVKPARSSKKDLSRGSN